MRTERIVATASLVAELTPRSPGDVFTVVLPNGRRSNPRVVN